MTQFKVGDKVVDNKGTVWEVFETDNSNVPYHCASTEDGSERWCWFTKTGKAYSAGYNGRELVGFAETDKAVQQPVSNKPHKHKDLIIAWANGKSIEFKHSNGTWHQSDNPAWCEDTEYRIKPEAKPDVVKTMFVEAESCLDNAYNSHNLKLTFCGETGKLKSAEVINKD